MQQAFAQGHNTQTLGPQAGKLFMVARISPAREDQAIGQLIGRPQVTLDKSIVGLVV